MITVEERTVNGIPLIEYKNTDLDVKGLTFMQHGFQSNKIRGGEYMAMNLCRLGYHVVCIDAYKHGDRKEEPYLTGSDFYRLKEAYNVINQTSLDILELSNTEFKAYKTFDMIGVSLGGMVAYLLATRTDKINRLIPVISTPDFYKQAYIAISAAGLEITKVLKQEELDWMEKIDPAKHMDQMVYKQLGIFISEDDDVVPARPVLKFIKQYDSRIDETHIYQHKHNVPREMQEDILSFIAGKQINL